MWGITVSLIEFLWLFALEVLAPLTPLLAPPLTPPPWLNLGVHKKRPDSLVDSYQRKGFSLGEKVSSCMSSVGHTEVGLVVKAIRVHAQMYICVVWNCMVFVPGFTMGKVCD